MVKRNSKADLLLHPVRMRIVMTLADQQMTAQQIARALPDVAQATLYRHIKRLDKGGIIHTVEEHQVRGAVEKVYSLVPNQAFLKAEDIAGISKDDHMQLFTAFVSSLMSDFAGYLNRNEEIDFVSDGVGFRTVSLYFTDEELQTFATKMNEILRSMKADQPGEGRKRRHFSTIILPAPDDANE